MAGAAKGERASSGCRPAMRVRHAHTRFPCPAPRSRNELGPDGGRALAAGLERLTALQTLNMRWACGGGYGEGWRAGRCGMHGRGVDKRGTGGHAMCVCGGGSLA